MEQLTKAIYSILHIFGCPDEDFEQGYKSHMDVCRKCGRVRFNFTRY